MKAMVLRQQKNIEEAPLLLEEWPIPEPGPREVLVKIQCCAVCRTDLHIIEGDLRLQRSPLIPGHQILGTIVKGGSACHKFSVGTRVGIAWLGATCGVCEYCLSQRENLCAQSQFTGYHLQGGYAEYTTALEDFVYEIPQQAQAFEITPLLCAGIIGYRALHRSQFQEGQHLGIFGFGSSAHIIIQIALHKRGRVSVVTRSEKHQKLSLELGAQWASGNAENLPELLDSAIIFAPAGELIPQALAKLKRGGTLAIAGIHLSAIPSLNYEEHLFYEKDLRSVTANTRQDGRELLREAQEAKVKPHIKIYELSEANKALQDLKSDNINGTAILQIENIR